MEKWLYFKNIKYILYFYNGHRKPCLQLGVEGRNGKMYSFLQNNYSLIEIQVQVHSLCFTHNNRVPWCYNDVTKQVIRKPKWTQGRFLNGIYRVSTLQVFRQCGVQGLAKWQV